MLLIRCRIALIYCRIGLAYARWAYWMAQIWVWHTWQLMKLEARYMFGFGGGGDDFT